MALALEASSTAGHNALVKLRCPNCRTLFEARGVPLAGGEVACPLCFSSFKAPPPGFLDVHLELLYPPPEELPQPPRAWFRTRLVTVDGRELVGIPWAEVVQRLYKKELSIEDMVEVDGELVKLKELEIMLRVARAAGIPVEEEKREAVRSRISGWKPLVRRKRSVDLSAEDLELATDIKGELLLWARRLISRVPGGGMALAIGLGALLLLAALLVLL